LTERDWIIAYQREPGQEIGQAFGLPLKIKKT
jgi:hypothetical protein